MNNLITLHSNLDKSVNFVQNNMHAGKPSITESRYVRRENDYFICYLSSHDGCNKACRFCHLTRTGQVDFNPTSIEDMFDQAKLVLNYYNSVKEIQGEANTVHYNWMARGEALASPIILNKFHDIRDRLLIKAFDYNLHSKFKISSIFPKEIETIDLSKNFDYPDLEFYYSLYSIDPNFRTKWLPNAQDYKTSLGQLAKWQQHTGNLVAIHQTFIENENDSEKDILDVIQAIQEFGLVVKFNLVRYNSYSSIYGKESSIDTINKNMQIITQAFGEEYSKIVPKVGFDAKCSCGMFYSDLGI